VNFGDVNFGDVNFGDVIESFAAPVFHRSPDPCSPHQSDLTKTRVSGTTAAHLFLSIDASRPLSSGPPDRVALPDRFDHRC
jgi:hypothetical protein